MSDIHAEIERAQTRPSVTQVLERMQPDIAKALPKGMDPGRVARVALTAIRQSELAKAKGTSKTSLSECTPESFAGSLLTAVALGLEPNLNGEAYLIPYRDRRANIVECQLIIGYQGLVKLFRQHPMAQHIGAQAVYANDHFDYQRGSEQFLRHRPAFGDRGEIIAYYADAKLTNGSYEFEVLSVDEVKALRGGKVGTSGDIPDPMRWMERKTALRQLMKLLPKQTAVDTALEADEKSGTELSVSQMPQTIMAAPAIDSVPSNVDPATGEITEPEPTTDDGKPDPQQVRMINPTQKRRVRELLGDDVAAGVETVAGLVGRPVAKVEELSFDEAALVIEQLPWQEKKP